jgi:hypothetical protein
MGRQGSPDDPFGELVAHNAAVRGRRARRRPGRRAALACFAVLFLAGLGLIGYGIAEKTGGSGTPQALPPTTASHPATAPGVGAPTAVGTTVTAATTAATTTAPEPPVVLVVHATRGDSWVELHAGTATGRTLYRGILRQGGTARASAGAVWARFGSLGNLDLAVNGKPLHTDLNGTVDITIGPGGLQ